MSRLHYIPLSQSYQELYNIHAFFSGASEATLHAANSTVLQIAPSERRTVDGDRRLRRLARAGKQWKRTIGRRVDMEGVLISFTPGRTCLTFYVFSVRVQTLSGVRATHGGQPGRHVVLALILQLLSCRTLSLLWDSCHRI